MRQKAPGSGGNSTEGCIDGEREVNVFAGWIGSCKGGGDVACDEEKERNQSSRTRGGSKARTGVSGDLIVERCRQCVMPDSRIGHSRSPSRFGPFSSGEPTSAGAYR
jgi:hypothetical protein